MAPSLRHACSPFRGAESIGARGRSSARPAVQGAAILLLCVLATQAWPSPAEVPATSLTILGRVVDEKRARVAGALVQTRWSGGPVFEGRTDALGRFRLEVEAADLADAADAGLTVLVRDADRVGVGSTSSFPHTTGFAGTIVVKRGVDVPVRLASRGRGVRVRAWTWTSPFGLLLAEAESDAEGRALLRNLPPRWIYIEADGLDAERDLTRETAAMPEVLLAARPWVPGVVCVGVVGVPPEARDRTWVEVHDPIRYARSGDDRRLPLALVSRGPIDVPPGASIRALTEPLIPPRATSPWVEVPTGARRIELEVVHPRPARWPVKAGSARVPPDGTVLRVVRWPNSRERAFPPSARIERGHVAVDALGPEHEVVWAIAPDGSAARLVASGGGPSLPTEFRRARTIDVRLREADGRSVVGALVQGSRDRLSVAPPMVFRPTDAGGRTRLVEFFEGPLNLTIAEGGWSWRHLVRVEASGDATLDVVVPPKETVIVRLLLDGRPGIPSEYSLACMEEDIEDAEEDAERGEIRFQARPSAPGAPLKVNFGGAWGWIPEGGREIGGLRREVHPGVPLTIRLRRLGMLRVRLAGANADDGRLVILESPQGDVWKPVPMHKADEDLYVSNRASLLLPLDRGTWRVRDKATGRTTEPVVIATPASQEIVERILDIGR